MIAYFSATGNSRYVAKRISEAIGDPHLMDISLAYKENASSYSLEGDKPTLIIVSPIYDWGLPFIVHDFLSRADFIFGKEKAPYIAFIATYGTSPGAGDKYVMKILKKKGLSLSFSYAVKMPDTWTPLYDLSDKKKVGNINRKAEQEINEAISRLKGKEKGFKMRNRLPYPLANLYYSFNYPRVRKTSHFRVEDSCIGCGVCEKMCPLSAIKMEKGRPTWTKDSCTMCLGCLHRCPKFAIQYGKKTKKHGQYQHIYYESKKEKD